MEGASGRDRRPAERESGRDETEGERLDRNLGELLQELRVALPGVQVLFAFLLAVPAANAAAKPKAHVSVVGGTSAGASDVPWQALVLIWPDPSSNSAYLCGGSILDATHILTAAHCVFDRGILLAQATGEEALGYSVILLRLEVSGGGHQAFSRCEEGSASCSTRRS